MGEKVALELRGVSKHFAGVEALSGVGFTVDAGEIVALVGDNGAGKSTLLKTLSGIHVPDSGSILVRGEEMRFSNPAAAAAAGLATVYQDLALCDNLDVVRNMFLGRELRRPNLPGAPLDFPAMEHAASDVLAGLDVKIPSLRSPVSRLSGGQRQGVAIGRSLLWDPLVLMLDEPTAALGVQQRHQVLELMLRLRDAAASSDRGLARSPRRSGHRRSCHRLASWATSRRDDQGLVRARRPGSRNHRFKGNRRRP